jgi:DNA helicase-2/ATP-dependent DNA helicase PcrA
MALLDALNERQREAVLETEGPLLVLAGAGTGKTRVITYRVAHLIEKGVPGSAILAVTFTNKAADQMKQRIADLLRASGRTPFDLWISTFHSFCARLLRREALRLGLPRDFAIYDEDNQLAALKVAAERLQLAKNETAQGAGSQKAGFFEELGLTARAVLAQISHAKNHGRSPEQLAAEAFDDRGRAIAKVFELYQGVLRKCAALDFDDLLLRAVELLRDHPEARAAWSERFRYILVDEYQDTNAAQDELVRLLAGERKNVCVVGDEDQSIYSWRGARAGNLQKVLEDFPKAQVIRLEENYRSTQTILDAAAAVVEHNRKRLGKTLRATLGSGERLHFFEEQDAFREADFVTAEIQRRSCENQDSRFAVFYRTNFQSRAMEEALKRTAIRYRLVGGVSFYERTEVRDALAYVRLISHPEDDIALLRVLNTPPRGLGEKSAAALRSRAAGLGSSLWGTLGADAPNGGTERASTALRGFRELIEGLQRECRALPPVEMLRQVLDRTGYLDWVQEQDKLEFTSRAENLSELVNAVADATEQGQVLQDVLDQAALVSDADEYDEAAPVTLMTLHSAKGLEFDHVFLVGLEEGLFPHSRSLTSEDDIEEERRLCYVGMTRAKKSLTLTRAIYRRSFGEERLRASSPSRFLSEIPGNLIETSAGSLADAGETRRYEPDPESSEWSAYRRPGRSNSIPGRAASRAGRSRAAATSSPLIGTRVRHPTYGVGTIIQVEGDGEDRKLTVSFLDYGTKKLLERYAHLEWA